MEQIKKCWRKSRKKSIFFLLSSLLWVGCTTEQSWNFKTNYFSIDVNGKGYITSMKNITVSPNREFSPIDKPSPLMSLYDSKKNVYYYPQKARFNEGTQLFTIDYPNGSVAQVELQPKDKYLKLSLVSLEPCPPLRYP